MAVIHNDGNDQLLPDGDAACFVCGQPMEFAPCLGYQGQVGLVHGNPRYAAQPETIYLHARCAEKLAARMASEATEASRWVRQVHNRLLLSPCRRDRAMADETTPAPLSDAALEVLHRNIDDQLREHRTAYVTDAHSMSRLLATLAALQADVERLKSHVAYLETMRQDAEFRYAREHEDRIREYDHESATLAAYREIVAAVADRACYNFDSRFGYRRCNECGQYGPEPLIHETGCLAAQARALLAGTQQAPGTTGATAGEEGE